MGHKSAGSTDGGELHVRQHTVRQFETDLSQFRELVLKMGRIVSQQVRDACEALLENRPALARMVIRREDWLDAMEVEANDHMIQLLVKRQPVGPDLRMVLALGWSVRDLERIGDEALRIAQASLEMYRTGASNHPGALLLRDVRKMSEQSIQLVDACLQTLDSPHVGNAVDVAHAEEKLGDEFSAALRRLATFVLEDSRNVGHVVAITLVLRSLERVGDHADNIAENVIYQVRGRNVRHHGSAADLEKALQLQKDNDR